MFEYDAQLLSALAAAPRSVAEVIGAMQAIDGICRDCDGLKWFNRLYLQVTEAVRQRIAAGGFNDTGWLGTLDVEFGKLYFVALTTHLAGGTAPDCWRALFSRRDNGCITRIQFALAGVNAHINHDLPLALVAVCAATGKAPEHCGPQYNDYTSVNSTLDNLIETAKHELMTGPLGNPVPPVAWLEDAIAAWSIVAARESAWTNAEVLWSIRGGGQALTPERYAGMLDGLTALAGKTLLAPVPEAALEWRA
jgi:hypothetical protein